MFIRIFSPSLNHRLSDPMPLPRRNAATRRVRIAVRNLDVQKRVSAGAPDYSIKKIPVNS